jgi:hypothetical protein
MSSESAPSVNRCNVTKGFPPSRVKPGVVQQGRTARHLALMLLVLTTGCRSTDSLSVVEPGDVLDCKRGEGIVCGRLRDSAAYFAADGARVNARLDECSVGFDSAHVVLRFGPTFGKLYSGLLRFEEIAAHGPLKPVEFTPRFMEWPCPDGCPTEDLRARLPILDWCEPNGAAPAFVDVTLPKIELARCADQLRFTEHEDPGWCTREPPPGEASYRVAQLRHLRARHVVEIDAGARVIITVRGRRRVLSEPAATRLRAELDAVWSAPSIADESCREDGGRMQIVEARREGAWKVLFRVCSSLVNLNAVVPKQTEIGEPRFGHHAPSVSTWHPSAEQYVSRARRSNPRARQNGTEISSQHPVTER